MNKQQIIDKQLSDFQNGSDGRDEYPELFNLFKKHTLRIDIDHPVGEDVIYINGKFNGYASDWIERLVFAEKFNIEYKDYDELETKVLDYQIEHEVNF